MANTIQRNLPDLSRRLLERLDELYPDRCPDPNDSERDVWIKAGQRKVVNFLWDVFDEQNETIISTKE
jgi:hypothetical protein